MIDQKKLNALEHFLSDMKNGSCNPDYKLAVAYLAIAVGIEEANEVAKSVGLEGSVLVTDHDIELMCGQA